MQRCWKCCHWSLQKSLSAFFQKETAGAFYNVTLITMAKHPGMVWGAAYDTPAMNNLKCLKMSLASGATLQVPANNSFSPFLACSLSLVHCWPSSLNAEQVMKWTSIAQDIRWPKLCSNHHTCDTPKYFQFSSCDLKVQFEEIKWNGHCLSSNRRFLFWTWPSKA